MQLSLSQTPKSISSANYLLRQYGGAAAAYSLQRLDTSTENVVRVRRSSDDAEADFTAEEVAGGALAAYCGVGDGFVVSLYDQSGNGRDATQATAASQPQIVSNGSVLTSRSKPCLSFNGSSTSLSNAWGQITGATARTTIAVYGNMAGGDAVSWGTVSAGGLSGLGGVGNAYRCYSGTDQITAGTDGGVINLITNTFDGTSNSDNSKLYLNGTKDPAAAVAGATENTGSSALEVGRRVGGSTYYTGKIAEVIIYASDKSSDRAAIEANVASRYGITLA